MEFTPDGIRWAREHVVDLSAIAINEILDEIERLQGSTKGWENDARLFMRNTNYWITRYETAKAEAEALSEQLHRTARELHRYQPAGSPPPGDIATLAAWVLTSLTTALSVANADGGIELRPEVRWFAEQMELKLRENDHKGGWSKCPVDYLFSRLGQEVMELDKALDFHIDFDGAISEAADVANFAMMIADNVHRARVGGAA